MSNEDGPPPMFDGDDFPYWKIRMESYLEACDTKCLKAATEGFTPPAKDTALTPQEQENEKWNAKAKNHIFRGLCKEVFNRVRNLLTLFFGHVSFDTHLELMECRSADGAMVISLQGSCR